MKFNFALLLLVSFCCILQKTSGSANCRGFAGRTISGLKNFVWSQIDRNFFSIVLCTIAGGYVYRFCRRVSCLLDEVNEVEPKYYKYLKPNSSLNAYEMKIISTLIEPLDIQNKLTDVGGLDNIKSVLLDSLLSSYIPLKRSNSLYSPIRSFILYGPPGCGKSMLARAVCRSLKMPLLVIAPSILMDKYVGETPKLTKAIFTLADKFKHCIIYMDEIDSLLTTRSTSEQNKHRRELITEFIGLWDAMNIAAAEGKNCAIIIGATNQYEALDEAVRRRFDLSLYIGLPDISARVDILKKILKDIELDPRWFDVKQVAKQTEGYSSRDLYLLCKAAVHIPVQEATLSLTAERKKSFLTRILKANEVSNKDSDIANSNRSTINAVNEANSSRIDRNESESFLRNKKEANDVKKYHQMISQEHNESDEISEKEETEDSNIVTPRPLRTLDFVDAMRLVMPTSRTARVTASAISSPQWKTHNEEEGNNNNYDDDSSSSGNSHNNNINNINNNNNNYEGNPDNIGHVKDSENISDDIDGDDDNDDDENIEESYYEDNSND